VGGRPVRVGLVLIIGIPVGIAKPGELPLGAPSVHFKRRWRLFGFLFPTNGVTFKVFVSVGETERNLAITDV